MRMFVAVMPPEEALQDLDAFLDVRRDAADFRWSSPEQWHLTLAFLADVRERQLDDLLERLGTAADKPSPFALRIAGGGAFPNPALAKVLYAGIEADEPARVELGHLVAGARSAAVGAGVAVDGKRFRPHLTLARFGHPQEATRWIRILDSYRGPRWSVDEVTLVESHLGQRPQQRPRYDTVATIPFSGPRGAA